MQPTVDEVRAALDYSEDTGQFRWKYNVANHKRAGKIAGGLDNGYWVIGINKRHYGAHRLAWVITKGHWPELFIDHINGDRADNRFCNLREASPLINQQNQRRANIRNKTGLLGVSVQRKKFAAVIQVGGRQLTVGLFDSPEQAHQAYVEAKRKHHAGCTI